jgi:hypothetical protein
MSQRSFKCFFAGQHKIEKKYFRTHFLKTEKTKCRALQTGNDADHALETSINHQNHRDKVETGGTENAGPERNEKGPVLKMHLSSRQMTPLNLSVT